MDQANRLSSFIKYMRRKNGLTQEELADRAGVGLRFIRDLEQGKQSLRLDKVDQLFALFGYRITPGISRKKDQWEVIMQHMNRPVHVYLKDKRVLAGVLVAYKMEEQKVISWSFLTNDSALQYRESKDSSLLEEITEEDLINVENY